MSLLRTSMGSESDRLIDEGYQCSSESFDEEEVSQNAPSMIGCDRSSELFIQCSEYL